MRFEPIGLGRKTKKGKGFLDTIKKGVRKVQDLKLAQKGLDAIQNNKLIRDVLEKTGTLRPVTKALVAGRRYGFGALKRPQMQMRGRGFFGDLYNTGKKVVSKALDVNSHLKKLGLARKAKSILPYAQKGALLIPKYGAAISAGLTTAEKPINWLANKGYGRAKSGVLANSAKAGVLANSAKAGAKKKRF